MDVLDFIEGHHEEREVGDVDQRVRRRLDEHHLQGRESRRHHTTRRHTKDTNGRDEQGLQETGRYDEPARRYDATRDKDDTRRRE